jgi:hypothetical protein
MKGSTALPMLLVLDYTNASSEQATSVAHCTCERGGYAAQYLFLRVSCTPMWTGSLPAVPLP